MNAKAGSVIAVVFAGLLFMLGCEVDDESSSSSASSLKIAPTSVRFSAASVTNITFTASGGTTSYTWRVSDATLGTVLSSGAYAVYTSKTNSGMNFLTVTDSGTNSVSATITQE